LEEEKEQTLPLTADDKSLKSAQSDLEVVNAKRAVEETAEESTPAPKVQQV